MHLGQHENLAGKKWKWETTLCGNHLLLQSFVGSKPWYWSGSELWRLKRKNPPGMFFNFFITASAWTKQFIIHSICKIQTDLILILGSFNFFPLTFHAYVSIHIPIYGVVLDYIHFYFLNKLYIHLNCIIEVVFYVCIFHDLAHCWGRGSIHWGLRGWLASLRRSIKDMDASEILICHTVPQCDWK